MGITLNTTTRGGDPKDKGRTPKTTKSQLSLEGAMGTPRSQPLIHGSALTRECHGNNAAHHIHPSVGKVLTWECRGVTLTPHPLIQGSALAWVPWEQRGTSHSRIRGWTTQPDIRKKKKIDRTLLWQCTTEYVNEDAVANDDRWRDDTPHRATADRGHRGPTQPLFVVNLVKLHLTALNVPVDPGKLY